MNVDQPTPSLRTLWVIYLAFCAATVFYTYIARMVTATAEAQPYPLVMTAVLAVAAVSTLGAAYIIPRGTWARAEAARQRDPDEALTLYQTAMIMHWACLEAVAIDGLVLSIVTGQWLPSLVGSVVALAFLASARPRPGNLGITAR